MARTIYDIPLPQTPISRAFGGTFNNVIISAINPFRGLIPQGTPADSPVSTSNLNTPVYSDLTLEGGTYTDDAGNEIQLDTINFQTVLMLVEQAKNIVTTQIAGKDGTVKEYIGLDDYRITVQCIITGSNGVYPEAEVTSLAEILNAPVPISVTSNFLSFFGITSCVVTDYSFPQVEGTNSYQPVNITFLSDNTSEFIVL